MSMVTGVIERPAVKAMPTARALAGVAGFALLTALAAHIRIPLPFTPVPVTIQTLVVLLSGLVLGPGFGALSQVAYVGLGVMGLPFFAGGAAGLAYLAGPTAGYIVGFAAAAAWVGAVSRRRKGVVTHVLAALGGYAAIYGCGTLWLAVSMKSGLLSAATLGIVPFLAGDAMKAAAFIATAAVYRSGRE